jgi:hypothetical protein
MTSRLLKGVLKQSSQQRLANERRELKHYVARLGGQVFGPIPAGVRREFFCLDRHTWVWHEEWVDQTGQHRAMTTRYDVRPTGILKSQGVNAYQRLSEAEERNFRQAVRVYSQRVLPLLQRMSQTA